MDVNDIFKAPAPKVGSVKNKRKAVYDFTPDPNKKLKNGDGEPKGKQRATTMEDLPDEQEEEEGADYTPLHEQPSDYDFAPNGDADYFAEEDADGRFFGGGLTGEQKEIIDILEGEGQGGADGPEPAPLDLAGVRRQLLGLERAINKNREMRTRFPDDPTKFVDSEFTLTEAIQQLALLTQNPADFYPELVRLSIVPSLAGLLSHENIDIAIAVIEMLEELTDDDVLEGEEEEDDDGAGPSNAASQTKGRESLRGLLSNLLENQLLDLLVSNLSRLNEAEEAERNGVFHTLGLVENLVSADPETARLLLSSTPLAAWLLARVQQPKPTPEQLQNRHYAAEILAILVQSEPANRLVVLKAGAVDILLAALSVYRKREPVDGDEIEFMENLFDALCSLLLEPETKSQFIDGEGVELMVLMMKAKMLARTRSIKVLDHACAGEDGIPCCQHLVEAAGLKTLFSAFMGKGAKGAATAEDNEHVLGIINSLLFNLDSDSPPRIRLLAKFVEDDYAKVDRLVELREQVETRVRAREGELDSERQMLEEEGLELDEVDEYLRRLDAGLFSLQLIDTILAFICMEDDGVRDHAQMLLRRHGRGFADVVKILGEYRDNIGDQVSGVGGLGGSPDKKAATATDARESEDTPGGRQRAAIGHLMEYLGPS